MQKIVAIAALTAASLVAAPQVVVFDFGGVMTGEPNREAVVNFLRTSLHLSEKEFETVNQEKKAALKEGKTDEEFWMSYARAKGIELPANWGASFKCLMKEAIGVNPRMYALVEELKQQRYQVALLSNIDERLSKLIREFGLYQSFNPCLLSCDIGLEKPSPKAYEFLLKQLNVAAQDVIFIDDRAENVEAAKALGLDAILFVSEQQLREELTKRGIAINHSSD